MKINDILKCTEHRPWDLPTSKWSFYQEWNNAIFLHWEVDIGKLEKFVPKHLTIDLFNGKAWVSLVAFTMEKIRPRGLPYFSPISNFNEINIRTYVNYNNKKGVYFLNIEGGKKLSCTIAKNISELPYRYSKMKRRIESYSSYNSGFLDSFGAKYKVKSQLEEKKEIDLWLTERYALFQDTQNGINEFEIHHKEWPIFEIEINQLNVKYPRFESLLKKTPRLLHYSPGVQVLAWNKIKHPL